MVLKITQNYGVRPTYFLLQVLYVYPDFRIVLLDRLLAKLRIANIPGSEML